MVATIIGVLLLILLLALTIERIVEFLFGCVAGFFPRWEPAPSVRSSTLQLVAVLIGLGGAFLYRFDILYLFSQFSSLENIPITPYGIALTGIVIGMGSSAVHDVIKYFRTAKDQAEA